MDQDALPHEQDPPAQPPPGGGGTLLESLDGEGWRWRVQIIRAGVSANGNEYPLPVLHEAAPRYNGVPVFPEHDPRNRRFDRKLGVILDPRPNADGLEAVFEVMRSRPDVREDMLQAWQVKQRSGRDLFGFSHSVSRFESEPRRPFGRRVTAIRRVDSVDLVMEPAAGGAVIAPVTESAVIPDALQEALVNVTDLLAKLRAGQKLGVDELAALQEAISAEELASALQEAAQAATPASGPAAPASDPGDAHAMTAVLTEAQQRLEQLERQVRLAECRALLTQRLAEAKLPERLKTAIASDFDNRLFEASELEARISRDRELYAELATVRPQVPGPVVASDQRDRWAKAMDGLFEGRDLDGISRFRSLKHAYRAISGTAHDSTELAFSRAILREASQLRDPDSLQESLTTSTFAELWGDSITRRMIREYQFPQFQSWRLITTDIVAINDFRTQRRMRMGGYGDLPAVGQGATYQSLSSPTDEEATYSVSKYGGLEDLTLEAIANDDVGAVRRIPVKLGRAAARTLYSYVWNTVIRDNATCSYDGVTLYHASHNNTGTTALSAAELLAVENAMRNQTAYGESAAVLGEGNMPRLLAIPNELRDIAYRLVNSGVAVLSSGFNATEPNMFQGRYQVIIIDDWTDPNNWYAFADPQMTPILEVGFLNGREEPELFVQDAATVGSNFTADKVTYKIRHIWGVGILDHRGTYREVVA